MDKLLLTPDEAAEALSIGRSKLYELIGQGRLSSVLIDASRRIPIDALVEFVAGLRERDPADTHPVGSAPPGQAPVQTVP